MTGPRIGVAVPAAGTGRRMGGVRKPFLEVAGAPVLLHALTPFLARTDVVAVCVALGGEDAADPPAWLREADARLQVVAGGHTRTESVRRALAALPDDLDVIVVHDAARPLLTGALVDACVQVALGGEGAVAGCPAVDTVKEVDGEARVVGTPDRSRLWYAHTPQAFPAVLLREAYARAGAEGTDDSALVEAVGGTVRMVDGGSGNLKVTRPADLPLAEAVLAARRRGERV